MNEISSLNKAGSLCQRFQMVSKYFLVLSVMLLVASALWPVTISADYAENPVDYGISQSSDSDIDALVQSIAGRRLIKPSQTQAAVMDDGAAGRLLKMLRLCGVIEVSGKYIAYVNIENKSDHRVVAGDQLLEFTVVEIKPGSVLLSLQGVEVTLTQ